MSPSRRMTLFVVVTCMLVIAIVGYVVPHLCPTGCT
jgi:hypothetical protein